MQRAPILLVGNFLSATMGTRGVCEDLADQLRRLGWPILSTSDKRNRLRRIIDMMSTVLRKRRDYSVAQVDVYSGLAFRWAEAVCLLLRLFNKPYILSLHGGNLPSFAEHNPDRTQHLLQSAAAVTAPSGYLVQHMKAYRKDLLLHSNPIQLSAYKFRLRENPGPRLVWLRAFHEIYNPSLAVEVLALLAKDYPSIQLFMIGPDRHDGSLQAVQRAAKRIGVEHQIKLVGKLPKSGVPSAMDQGDIFLNTTNFDNTPVSIIEAMASGLCIVSTDVGGIPYLLQDGRDALLVPRDDCRAMAEAVRRLMTEPGLAARLSANARKKAEEFDWSAIIPKWERLISSVVQQSLN